MKRPARFAAKMMKRPAAAASASGRGARKKKGVTHICKPIAEMTPKDFLFFHIPAGRDCFTNLRGCKSPRKGYMFEHIDFNLFDKHDTKIPKNAKRVRTPDSDWLSEFFWDPAKHRLLPVDPSALPERASGSAYRIIDNGGTPFICYVRDDAVSVFRKPKDAYLLAGDWPGDSIDELRPLYTEEVATFTNIVKVWIGIDEKEGMHGNSILVHVPPSSKGKCVTAMISLEPTSLQVTCVDLAGTVVTCVTLTQEDKVATLVNKIKECLQCSWVACFSDRGEEVKYDRPLKEFTQVVLKDATQSYVYIGESIQSFDACEVVTAYYSMMGPNEVPYPVAVTPTTTMYMLDMVQVPRKELAPFVTSAVTSEGELSPSWGRSYRAFYERACTQIPMSKVKTLCPRGI